MDFEEVQSLVDGFDEADLFGEAMKQGDAATAELAHAFGQFVVEIAAREHGSEAEGPLLGWVEAILDLSLAAE